MKSYGEPLVEKFILHLHMIRQELRTATDSYGELRRAMGTKVHITFKHDQTRATESYGELWELRRAMV